MSTARVIGAIAGTNLRRLGRDRLGLFFILVLPFLIILLFGAGGGGGAGTTPIGVVGDAGDPAVQRVLDELRADDAVVLSDVADRAELEVAVRRRQLAGGLVLPDRGGQLELVTDPAGDPRAGTAVQEAVDRADAVLRPAAVAAQAAGVPAADLITAVEGLPSAVEVDARLATDAGAAFDPAQRGAVSNLVLFVFITSLVGSAALIESRALGLTRRTLAGPVSGRTVLLGEGAARYLVAAGQGVVILIGARLLFGVDWVAPARVLAVVALFALVGTGAAMLFGALFSNAEQASGVAVPVGIGLGMLGGCMWPLEITPPVMQAIGRLTPHAWALDALDAVIAGEALPVLPMAVLGGFAAVLLAVAAQQLARRAEAGR